MSVSEKSVHKVMKQLMSQKDKDMKEREYTNRLSKVVRSLLEFKSKETAIRFLTTPTDCLDNYKPIDLVDSAWATDTLIGMIRGIKEGNYC